MGTRWSSSNTKVDFVLELPPELVAKILFKLTLSDVLKCMLVCKRWRDTILHHGLYWSGQLQNLGTSQESVSHGVKHFPNHRDLYLAVNRHQQKTQSLKLVSSMATCYPRFSIADCFFMTRLNTVARLENFQDTRYLKVEEIHTGGVVATKELCSIPVPFDLPVTWVHYSSYGCVYWTDSSGQCWGHSLEAKGELMHVELATREESMKGESEEEEEVGKGGAEGVGLSHATRVKTKLADTKPLLAGCDKCSMLLACWCDGEIEGNVSSIDLSVGYLLHPGTLVPVATLQQRLKHNPSCRETRFKDRAAKLEVCGAFDNDGNSRICPFHYALLQDRESTVIIFLKTKECWRPIKFGPRSLEIKCECMSCCHQLSCGNVMTTSPCGSLLGHMGEDRHLHVWEVCVETSTIKQSCRAKILAKSVTQSKLELVALGRHLSIVRQEGTGTLQTPEDSIYVIHTESGKLLKQVNHCIPVGCRTPHQTLPSYLLSREAQQWLCDVSAPCPHTLLTVVCSDGGTARFLLLQQASLGAKGHYVQAVNYIFQQ